MSQTNQNISKQQSHDKNASGSKKFSKTDSASFIKVTSTEELTTIRKQSSKSATMKDHINNRSITSGSVDMSAGQKVLKNISQSSQDNSLRKSKTSQLSKKISQKGSITSIKQPIPDNIQEAVKSLNQELPNVKHDIKYTKLFLQKQGLQNISVWSHLTDVLNKIISEQPENVIDYFEEYSRKVKQERLLERDTLKDIYVPISHLENAKNQLSLVNAYGIKESVEKDVGEEEEEKEEPPQQMDLEEAAFYFRQAGVAIPDNQLFVLNIGIKKLVEEKKILKHRFWGKLFGTKQDYFVLECELTEEEYEKRAEEDKLREEAEAAYIAAEQMSAEAMEEISIIQKEEEERLSEENIEEVEKTEQINKEEKINLEEQEDVTEMKDSVEYMTDISLEVKFDLREDEEGKEIEDPTLPPLPPPKKLLNYKIPPILKPVEEEIIKIPPEKIGEGLNRKIYYITNAPEMEWIELPKVTPAEINVARQIKVCLTGDLESKIITYPAFPGVEKNYLRAQIARISSATQVSPLGFYKFGGADEEEEEEIPEEEEEEAAGKMYVENRNFQPIPIKDMIDPSFGSWVHHSPYILKQGRTEWWSAKKKEPDEEEAEEEQEEEEEEEEEGEEKETGPALLTPLSDDATIDGTPAWSVRKTHEYNSNIAAAVIKSNLWPGSCAFAIGKKFENVYFGWGHKHTHQGFSLSLLPHPDYEYDLGPEIMEIQDPTVEVEQAWRQAHKKELPSPSGEEEEEQEEEEDEDEEEEDD